MTWRVFFYFGWGRGLRALADAASLSTYGVGNSLRVSSLLNASHVSGWLCVRAGLIVLASRLPRLLFPDGKASTTAVTDNQLGRSDTAQHERGGLRRHTSAIPFERNRTRREPQTRKRDKEARRGKNEPQSQPTQNETTALHRKQKKTRDAIST